MKKDKKYIVQELSLFAACGLFALLMLLLSFYNRFAADDYFQIFLVKQYGILGGMIQFYHAWGGRWASYLLYNTIYHFYESHFVLFIYSLSVLILFTISIFKIFKIIFDTLQIEIHNSFLLPFSILFVSLCFYISSDTGEIWFWVNSTGEYLVCLSFFLLGISILFSGRRNLFAFLFLAISFTFSGGGCEAFALFFIFIFTLAFLSYYYFRKHHSLQKYIFIKFLFSFLFLSVSFILSVSAPGNFVRQSTLPEPTVVHALKITLMSCYKIFLPFITSKLPFVILFCLPWLYLGSVSENIFNKMASTRLLKYFIISLIITLFFIYIFLFPATYILSDLAPERYQSVILVIVGMYCCAWSFIIGNTLISKKISQPVFYFSVSIIMILNGYSIFTQYKVVSRYSHALSERISYLKELEHSGNKKTVSLSALPSSGYLFSAEISQDSSYFLNEHFKEGLSLSYFVKLKE